MFVNIEGREGTYKCGLATKQRLYGMIPFYRIEYLFVSVSKGLVTQCRGEEANWPITIPKSFHFYSLTDKQYPVGFSQSIILADLKKNVLNPGTQVIKNNWNTSNKNQSFQIGNFPYDIHPPFNFRIDIIW